jgi:succinoglycan biosynthesis protein ExoO
MRYVFITDELPRPGTSGHLALNFAILSWLQAQGHEVTVLLLGARMSWPLERYDLAPVAGPQVKKLGNHLLVTSALAIARILLRALVRRLPFVLSTKLRTARQGADTVLGRFCTKPEARWCARFIARTRPDAVLVDTIFRAPILAEPELAGVNSVLIAHDVFHRRHRALLTAGYSVQPRQLTREDEAALASHARHIAAIQPDEAALLAAMCPAQNVFTAPMPALPCPALPGTSRLKGRLVFVGSDSLPNLDGLRWFLADVWPLLRPHGITLDLVGDCGPALRQLPDGVTRLGRVNGLAVVLHRAALAISPLRVGSGLKIKLLDYARHGLFTVATPPSLQGFAPDEAEPFIAAETATAFANAVLFQIKAPATPDAALAYIARHYGVAASFAGLGAALGLRSHASRMPVT